MKAYCEKPDGTYEDAEVGEPICGEDFCDGCGDCLACQWHDEAEWCNGGQESFWVMYKDNKKNPFHEQSTS